ncbi:MAG TPA: hypothetical protein VK550_20200 [Polyangiaceae bacterium]|nr:hypothetical protein [Polyangiaceae bacterium]
MYQSVYEGDVRFEHCYRVDEERQVPINDKLQCWRDWSHRYSHGQSRDRLGYALARERTLAQALAAGAQAAPPGAVGIPPCPLPQPTSAFAPPPQTMTPASAPAERIAASAVMAMRTGAAGDGGTNAEGSSVVASESSSTVVDAPGASCTGACGKTWSGCKQQCKGAPCRSGCDEHYRTCMRSCF